MKKFIIALFALLLLLAGCAGSDEEKNQEQAAGEAEQAAGFNLEELEEDDIVATIHGHEVTGKDLLYEMKRLELISVLEGEEVQFEEISPKVAIQELIQNHLIEMLASERGIAVNTIEQKERAEAVKADVEAVEGYDQVMAEINENLFWSKEEARYETIIEAETLITELMEELQEDYPTYDEQALRFEALEALDELIQEMTAEAEVEIFM